MQGNSLDELEVCHVASRLPNVIPASDCDNLITEVRLFNVLGDERGFGISDSNSDVSAMWTKIAAMKSDGIQRFPLLSSLSSACFTIFHANADVERIFGKSSDIDAMNKRNLLSGNENIELLI